LFLDADVELPLGFLEFFLKKIKDNKLDFATCKIVPKPNDLCSALYYATKNFLNKYFGYIQARASGQCIFIKKELFNKIGGYDITLVLAEEHDLAARAKKKGKFHFFTNIFVYNNPRRVKKEGCLKLFIKNGASELYRIFIGKIKKPLFNYDYEH